ncbi:MAG TPA: rhodanese-like domain-containing protein [Acidimicrobiales bacterium]
MSPASGEEISVEEARALDGAVLLDVREITEWTAGHAPDAVHVPMYELTPDHPALAAGSPIVCICRSGNRSRTVTDALVRVGLDARNMAGGMKAWSSAGFPVVDSHGNPGQVL